MENGCDPSSADFTRRSSLMSTCNKPSDDGGRNILVSGKLCVTKREAVDFIQSSCQFNFYKLKLL